MDQEKWALIKAVIYPFLRGVLMEDVEVIECRPDFRLQRRCSGPL